MSQLELFPAPDSGEPPSLTPATGAHGEEAGGSGGGTATRIQIAQARATPAPLLHPVPLLARHDGCFEDCVGYLLSDPEIEEARTEGEWRQARAEREGRQHAYGLAADHDASLSGHIRGVSVEVAIRRWLGLRVPLRRDGFGGAEDLPGGIQARWSSAWEPELIIRPGDPANHHYVLGSGYLPRIYLHGWLDGTEVIRAWLEPRGGRPAAYFVPHGALHSLSTLPRPTPAELELYLEALRHERYPRE